MSGGKNGGRDMASDSVLMDRLLEVMENDVIPLTALRVKAGSKVFGAAVLLKSDLSLVLAESNMEALSPLWHGEVYAIKHFWEMQGHPDPADCIFLATHQPCCMCASAVAWSGFPEMYYYFGYEHTGELFNIPHDQKMIRELFNCPAPAENSAYYSSEHILKIIDSLPDKEDFAPRLKAINEAYERMSAVYQAGAKKMVLK